MKQPRQERHRHDPGTGPVLLGAAAVLAAVLCCAGPVLLTAGALAGIGGMLGNPWVIAATGALLAAALVALALARRHTPRGDRCCPPPSSDPAPTATTHQPDREKD
ncbi:hypothetical protein [Mycolicibacterium llatzerense]|uniref:hypothetical protein n=1 Tax=Mycolicibacterium llatzerense TaxID=280871 RepID=UPI0008DC7976|nr:hypothetical protein [Mycolicibacterium llatzerense]